MSRPVGVSINTLLLLCWDVWGSWGWVGVHVPVTGCCPEKQRSTGVLSCVCPPSRVTGCATNPCGTAVLAGTHLPCSCSCCILRIWHRSFCTSSSMWPWGGGGIGGDVREGMSEGGHQGVSVAHGPHAPGLAPGSSPLLPPTCTWALTRGWLVPRSPIPVSQFPYSHVPISPALHRAGGSGTASPPCCVAFLSPARERVGLSVRLGACGSPEPTR